MESVTVPETDKGVPEFLAGGGELGELIRKFDWMQTSLGPVDKWPHSLRTCVRIMLTSRQPIWIGWGKELIKFYNDPYKAIVGGKHPWALGKPASEVWKDIWVDIEPMLKRVMEEDEGTYVESQLLIMERNGYPEETYYTFSYTPIPGDDGKTAGMFCANTDDTEKIIGERQLRTLTQLGKNLGECKSDDEVIAKAISTLEQNPHDFPFAVFRTIEDGKAILAGSTALGKLADVLDRQIDLSAKTESAQMIKAAVDEAKPQQYDSLQKLRDYMPKGAWNVVPDKVLILPVVQASTKMVHGVLTVGLNPYRLLDEKYESFLKLITDQITTAFADVHVLVEERKRAEALAEIDRAKTTFFSNISHEFRTPLTLLLSPIEDMLQDPNTRPENRPRVEVAYRNALRMQKLVNTLLEFSRIEAGRVEGRFEKVDISIFTQDLASTFRSAIEKAGLDLVFDIGTISDDVYVDTDMWERIVLNLVSNAFKYSKKGLIKIALRQNGQYLQLSVSDTGIGIPADQLDKIFNRFHRVENSEGRSQEGTGIGLAMVKELVKLHQGSIIVASEEGKGSTFTVSIPTGKSHLPKEKVVEQNTSYNFKNTAAFVAEASKWVNNDQNGYDAATAEDENPLQGDRPTVLLADDNADMRDYVQRLLADQFNIVTAVNGDDAYEKVLKYKPDLVLSDIMMPKTDGFGLLKNIRSHKDIKNTPVIFLSARAGEEAKIEGLDAGADDYMVKPFSARELLVRVSNHIRINQVRKETEQQFYELFMQAPAIINVFRGRELRYEVFHPKNAEYFGTADFTGMTLREAIPELQGQGVIEMLEEVFDTGKTIRQNEIPIQLVNEKGERITRYFNVVYQPWFDHKEQIQGVLNYASDVTETVEARKKIEESEAYFRKLADTIPAMLWTTEKDGSCSYLNKRWFETTGQTKEEAMGFGWLKAVHPEDSERSGKVFVEANEKQIPFELIYRLRTKDGDYRWSMDNGSPRWDADGSFAGYIGTVLDVHEQMIATNKIRESEEQFRSLAETLPQLVWMTSPQGGKLFASTRWQEYTGIEPSNEAWLEVVHPDDMPVLTNAWNSCMAAGKFYRIELRLKGKDGNYRWFFGQGEPIRNDEGEIIKWIGSFTDVHDQKELEQHLEKLVRERTAELQRSNEDLQQFAHVASHDLKEPVRKIRTFSDRLQTEYSDLLPDKGKLFLDKVQHATSRMFAMIDGVLNYSTINASQQEIETVDLNEIFKNIQNDLELVIQQKQATINTDILPTVQGAPVLLYQLFYNLVNNSLKFSRSDTPLVLNVTSDLVNKKDTSYVRIDLADNGIGFEQEYADKIFDTFTRLNSKDSYEGTGLGLALCKKIVERHHGMISAKGTKNQGAIFEIVLPVEQAGKSL